MAFTSENSRGLDAAKQAIGNAARLAEALGLTPGAISRWQEVPLRRVLDVERVTGISRTRLRPDLFGPAHRRSQ